MKGLDTGYVRALNKEYLGWCLILQIIEIKKKIDIMLLEESNDSKQQSEMIYFIVWNQLLCHKYECLNRIRQDGRPLYCPGDIRAFEHTYWQRTQ